MNDPDERTPEELERLAREQDARAGRADLEHAGRTQLGLLRARLMSFGISVPVEATGNWTVTAKGEVIVWWQMPDGFTYGEWDRRIIVEREARGGTLWTVLADDDGKPIEPWQLEAPPPWRLMLN